jgi:hypothetical protein
MNKYERLFNQSNDDKESKKLSNLMNKGKLALENYVNNVQLKIIEKEAALEDLDCSFVKGDTSVISTRLEVQTDIGLLKEEVSRVKAYQKEMFSDK